MSELLRALLDARDVIVVVGLLAVGYFQGRRNERRHLAELARREENLRDILVFATRYPPPLFTAVALDPVLVTGSAAVAADYFKMFVGGLRKLVGGRFTAYESLVARARRAAMVRLKEEARAAGCTMVFNVRIETTQITAGARGGSSAVEVLACGTAFAPAAGSVTESVHHYRPGPPPKVAEIFDLQRHPATRKALLAFAAGAAYFFAEVFGMQDDAYVGSAPTTGLTVLALLSFAAMALWLRRRRVPLAETGALSLLGGLIAFGVGYHAALRANAATDFTPVRETIYVLQPGGTLRARDGQTPDLRFPSEWDYWSAQTKGSEHRFTLRRGMLGFWQFNQKDYHARLRAYFEARR